MYISGDTVVQAAAVLGAVLAIAGFIWGIIKWILKQNRMRNDLDKLYKLHCEDTRAAQEEMCLLTESIFAVLDGLKQLNCNGEVTKAYEKLTKHLNKQAHDQL